jgi:hypothetical protein
MINLEPRARRKNNLCRFGHGVRIRCRNCHGARDRGSKNP